PRPRARVGLYPELDAVDAVGSGCRGIGRDLGQKPRALESQRLELRINCTPERLPRTSPGRRQGLRPFPIARIGFPRRALETNEGLGTGVEHREIVRIARG